MCTVVLTGCVPSETEQDVIASSAEVEDYSKLSRDQYIAQVHSSLAKGLEIKKPPKIDPASVQFFDVDEVTDQFDSCMSEKGYSKNESEKKHTESFWEQYKLDAYICHATHLRLQKYAKPFTAKTLKQQYEWNIKYLIPCLQALGYEVSSTPPSLQQFIDTWETPEAWIPVSEVEPYGIDALIKADNTCLQEVPGSVRFGEISIAEWKKLGRGGWWTG